MHRLEAVAHIGQRARDDDAHGVIEVASAHLLFDGDDNGVARARGLLQAGVSLGRRPRAISG